MPKMHINKSIQINAPANQIFNKLNDFHNWEPWSPWLIQEEGVKVDVAEDGKYYEWKGQRVGTGNMKVIDEKEAEFIDYDLNFLTPWKSHAKVRFEFKQNGEGTNVSWLMDSGLPFFLFWMKKMMTAFVGMDYERGLLMLKDYIEDGEPHSKLNFVGKTTFHGCQYVGIKTHCTKAEVGEAMKNDFTRLGEFMSDKQDLVSGQSFSIYHKWDMVKDKIVYTSGIPVSKIPKKLPDNMISGNIKQTPVYTLRHTGPYRHLGNAWSTMYSLQRAKSFKMNKKIHPFETYINVPGEVDDKDLITDVHFAIKQ